MPGRVLIVDDMAPARRLLAEWLTAEYYEVLSAPDGAQALELIQARKPDIILLDVMMPDLDGYEICQRIKSTPETAQTPVVMITALGEPEDRIRGLKAGADDFLTKPVDPMALLARVRSLLRLKAMFDQWRVREKAARAMGIDLESNDLLDPASLTGAVVLAHHDRVAGDIMGANLEKQGYAVAQMAATDALPADVRGQEPDMVMIDAGLGEPALRLSSQIRADENFRDLPILLIGYEEDRDLLLKGLELGVNDYVLRPVHEEELIVRVRTQILRKRYQDKLKSRYLDRLSLAFIDSLTGLHNRRYLEANVSRLVTDARVRSQPLCLLMVDVDHFKSVNDTYGHDTGDIVLHEVAKRLTSAIRSMDLIARYGGEEFTVVIPDSDIDYASHIANRICDRVAETPVVTEKGDVSVTVSVGVAELSGTDDLATLLERADQRMLRAKNLGRNRVIRDDNAA
ncbi:MAG: PleD family two-component system response regulator [Magnetospiraceae bacterium]